jgi:nicotinamide-nucleotide amidase
VKNRVVELIAVGTEILLGNIVNTNAAYLSEKCAELGFSCYYQSVVGDNAKRLEETIRQALSRADIVLLSGGLGPTEDDLTKETAAAVLGKKLVLHEKSREAIRTYFRKKGMEIAENNWKQAMVPEDCIVIDNPNGTAPGIIMEDQGRHLILMPGPPGELIPMFEDSISPYLQNLQTEVIYSKTVKVCGVGESKAEMQIKDLIDQQSNPTIATYAKIGEVHLRVTARAESKEKAKQLVKPMVKELKRRFGDSVYTTKEKVTLEQSVADLLKERGYTITTAESCTGGMLAARLINVPGVSEVYRTGFITYANKAKRKELGVLKETLRLYGTVSRETAMEMVRGAAEHADAEVALATTGIAGPDGGTETKPVGLVYISCYVAGEVTVREYRFSGNRAKIRESAVAAALTLARECLLRQEPAR